MGQSGSSNSYLAGKIIGELSPSCNYATFKAILTHHDSSVLKCLLKRNKEGWEKNQPRVHIHFLSPMFSESVNLH